ncbi:helix-turn-helix domain-containing protein [Kordiimonas sp. SCSIO 12603]|uniref:helix-turn-helix domain-containing protein n=1 Tax=Kordiimonas sp. SCSIO 12603 TaxID=2829596 RepID=UPI0021036B79|nr:helix-turn-helix domain-containing protein [Kordiimonas sp. SCSIO 12603]UTW59968.1 helix-turn-helix domain-containing protein [Kordiimonas sp. SCSIO 12603]
MKLGCEKLEQQKAIKAKFLDFLSEGYSVVKAAEAAGVSGRTVYKWRRVDIAFAVEWEQALDIATDLIEEEAMRRAVKGVAKPVYRGGEVVGHVQDYSDSMLMFLLKARRPEKYNDKAGKADQQTLDTVGVKDALLRKFRAVAQPPKKN